LDKQTHGLEETKSAYEKSLEKAERQYEAGKQSYADWLQARATIGSSQEDSEVRSRAQILDRFRQIQESWQARIDEINAADAKFEHQRETVRRKSRVLEQAANEKYTAALQKYEIRIFLIRLAMVLPVLGLAVLVFIRFRKNRFWPLAWGFILFSLYVFFVGLVPYLPSFGGYIRLTVGAVLTLFVGFYVIKQLGKYLQKKKNELEESTQDRALKIKDETALRAYQSHSCPSCERDFLIGKWYPKTRQATEIRSTEEAPDHCAYCGLPLFGKCPQCGARNFLHFSFCASCGRSLETLKTKNPGPARG
jgi:ribosomal protein L34E